MNTISGQTAGGISFLSLLTLLFIGLKLAGYISWSWIWVLGPIWMPFALLIGGLIIGAAITISIHQRIRKGK